MIVESPAKAKTINKYLGGEYISDPRRGGRAFTEEDRGELLRKSKKLVTMKEAQDE